MNRIRNSIRKFIRAEAGIAMTEFAVVLPVLMTLFYGCIEVTRYVLITQKVEKLAHATADVTAQESIATINILNQALAATSDIMKPYSMTNNGRVIISSLYKPTGQNAKVNWQFMGGGTLAVASKIGAVNTAPALPGGFTFTDGENVISAEVYYRFSPLVSTRWFGTTTIYRSSFYSPRFGALLNAPV